MFSIFGIAELSKTQLCIITVAVLVMLYQVCRALWWLLIPKGLPDVLKYSHTVPPPSAIDADPISVDPSHCPEHPFFWIHPHHHALPDHSFTPKHVNSGTPGSLLAGAPRKCFEIECVIDVMLCQNQSNVQEWICFKRIGAPFLSSAERYSAKVILCKSISSYTSHASTHRIVVFVSYVTLEHCSTLHELVTKLIAAGPEALRFLCENDFSGVGVGVVPVLNDLLAQTLSSSQCQQHSVTPERPFASDRLFPPISPLYVACMTRTLQVYMRHPTVLNVLSGERQEDTDSGDDAGFQAFYSSLALLREFPVDLVTDVHRELFLRKMLKRRLTSNDSLSNCLKSSSTSMKTSSSGGGGGGGDGDGDGSNNFSVDAYLTGSGFELTAL